MTIGGGIDPAVEAAAQHVLARAIHAAVDLGIAEHLRDGARTTEDVARLVGAEVQPLRRLLRVLSGQGFVREEQDGRFALGALGLALLPNRSGSDRAIGALASLPMWNALGRLADGIRTGATPRVLTGGRRQYQGELSAEQAHAQAETMKAFHHGEAEALLAAYDFSQFTQLVDVGGSSGNMVTTILSACPALSGIIFDLPSAAAHAEERVRSAGLSGRCKVVGGSFFDSVPAGGDAYLLSHIIHDWGDEDVATIFRNVRVAIRPDGRLLVTEWLAPPPNQAGLGALMDLILLTTLEGRLRSLSEHESLFGSAGFRLEQHVTTSKEVSILVAVPV